MKEAAKKGLGGGESNLQASMYAKCEEARRPVGQRDEQDGLADCRGLPPGRHLHKEVRDLLSDIGTSISRVTDDSPALLRLKARLCELLRDYSRFSE